MAITQRTRVTSTQEVDMALLVIGSSDLRPVAQKLIRQHASHHSLADRNRPYADARIVAPLRHDLGLCAGAIDGLARRQDR